MPEIQQPDLPALLRQLEAERDDLVKLLDEKEDDIDAIKRAIAVSARIGAPQIPVAAALGISTAAPVRPPEGLTEAVRRAIDFSDLMEGEFDVRIIEDYIKRTDFKLPKSEPRSRIAMVLQKLTERGEIIRTFEGSGRMPHRYKKAEQK